MSRASLIPVHQPYPPPSSYLPPPDPRPAQSAEDAVPWARYVAACRRHKWTIFGLTALGAGLGVVGSRLVEPEYQASATIWISDGASRQDRGPIRASEIMSASAWPELLRSFAILDKVVGREQLYLQHENPGDSIVFAGFALADRIRPGEYELRITPDGHFGLFAEHGKLVDSGLVGDSIGWGLGFRWQPTRTVMRVDTALRFRVTTMRAASLHLRSRLDVMPSERTNLLGVMLRGADPDRVARTLNALLDEFVSTAAALKKRTLVENAVILREQLDYAYRELQAAEVEYETFRVNTITLPSEGSAVVAGVELTRDPVFSSYFDQRVELDRARRDLASLERFLRDEQGTAGSLNVLWGIPAVEAYGAELRAALSEYATQEASLRSMLTIYTDAHPSVVDSQRRLNLMRQQVILPLIRSLTTQLHSREDEIEQRLGSTAQELRQIPQRTIEELRLKRNVAVRENLYTLLKDRFEAARLAEASSLPDVSILDLAAAPQFPTRNTAPRLIAMATAAGLGFAILLALASDRLDRRLRYPEQVTQELRLPILGAVPTLSRRAESIDVREASQVVEAFRSVRLALFHALGGQHPIQFAVSSPGMGDGKSLVSANLALAFAEVGHTTLLLDGDIRRGALHSMFGLERRPGLLDHLAGDLPLDTVLQRTGHPNLTLLASGTRLHRGPELLMGPALPKLMSALRSRYQVIVIDTPPLGASIDPFALGAAAGNMLIVVRSGETDRRLAMAKLDVLDRLPIHVLGAVLNDITASGAYKYYSYIDGYAIHDDESALSLASTTGEGHGI